MFSCAWPTVTLSHYFVIVCLLSEHTMTSNSEARTGFSLLMPHIVSDF